MSHNKSITRLIGKASVKGGDFAKTQLTNAYYQTYGVKALQDAGYTGAGVKIMLIDGGLAVVTDDLTNFTVVNFADTGSGDNHGIATCSIIGALDNAFGTKGVAPGATYTLGDVDDSENDIYNSSLIAALNYVYVQNTFDIVSISLASTSISSEMDTLLTNISNQGTLIFAACGNSGDIRTYYPASHTRVISVGSYDPEGEISTFTTRNAYVDVFAPGEDFIIAVNNDEDLVSYSGTSMSTPFAAGLAALLLEKKRDETNNATYRYTKTEMVTLLNTADYLGPAPDTDWWQTDVTAASTTSYTTTIVVVAVLLIIGVIIVFMSMKDKSKKGKIPRDKATASPRVAVN